MIMTYSRTADAFEKERLNFLERFDNKDFKKCKLILIAASLSGDCRLPEDIQMLIDELGFELSVDESNISDEFKRELLSDDGRLKALKKSLNARLKLQEKIKAAQSKENYLLYQAKELMDLMEVKVNINKFNVSQLRALVLAMDHAGINVDYSLLMFLVKCIPLTRISKKAFQHRSILLSINEIKEMEGHDSFYSACKSYWENLQTCEIKLSGVELDVASESFEKVHDILRKAKKRLRL